MPKKNNTPAKPALAPEEALFQAVSLCRKAGALTMGFDAVEEACVKGKAWLVMTRPSPRQDRAAPELRRGRSGRDHHAADPGPAWPDISRKAVAVYAVTDRNLAKLLLRPPVGPAEQCKNEEDMSE